MSPDPFWTWALLYWVGGCAWIGWRVVAWHYEPPITRPAGMSPTLFTVAMALAALIASPFWPLITLIDVILWVINGGGSKED